MVMPKHPMLLLIALTCWSGCVDPPSAHDGAAPLGMDVAADLGSIATDVGVRVDGSLSDVTLADGSVARPDDGDTPILDRDADVDPGDAGAVDMAPNDLGTRDVGPMTVIFRDGAGYDGTADTELRRGSQATNYGALNDLEVKGADGQVVLVRWDISRLPTNAIVDRAVVTLRSTLDSSGSANDVLAVNVAWVEAEATWLEAKAGHPWEAPGCYGATEAAEPPVRPALEVEYRVP